MRCMLPGRAVIVAGLVVALATALAGSAWAKTKGAYVPGEVLVRFRPAVPEAQARGVEKRHGAQEMETLHGLNVKRLRVPVGAEDETVAALSAEPGVLYAEPNLVVHVLQVAPIDPYFSGTYVGAFGSGSQWGPQRIGAPDAWTLSTGAESIIIAINDTGVDATHPDLAGKLVPGTTFISGQSETQDGYGHGTHVAGIAAAASNNGVGIAGLAWDCKIMPIRVISDSGTGTTAGAAKGVIWAADHGANVINMSYGSGAYTQTEQDAMNYANSKGCVLVAAAGNDGDTTMTYPAGDNYVLGIGATTATDVLASFSTFNRSVEVAAPGTGILSLLPTYPCALTTDYGYFTNYDFLSGTSMATPHVAGVAALYMSYAPVTTPLEVRQALEASADAVGGYSGWSSYYGYGRLDASGALRRLYGTGRAAEAGGIVGQVTYDGLAASATVYLYLDEVLLSTQRTGTPGIYRFSNVAAGEGYRVVATTSLGTTTVDSVSVPQAADAQVDVAIEVAPQPPPSLSVSPTSLAFTATAGGSNPSAQSFQIANTGGGTLTWHATETEPWFYLGAIGGTAPSTVTVYVNTAGLAAGTYSGSITVDGGTGTESSPQTVSVTLVLTGSPPSLSVSPTSLTFTGTAGGSNPPAQSFRVANTGGGTLTWHATETEPWFYLGAIGGTAPSTITVYVNTAGLAAGAYSGSITVDGGTGTESSPRTVPVTLILTGAVPALSISPGSLTFTGTVGGGNPPSQSLRVTNTGGGTLTWHATETVSWFYLSSVGGTAPNTVTVQLNTAGLAAGTYTGSITVDGGTGTTNSPQTVPVTLVLTGAVPSLSVTPASLTFNGIAGGSTPPSQSLRVTNTGGGKLTWRAAETTSWFYLSAVGGTAPSTITVRLNTAGLAAGTYTGSITLEGPTGATNSPQTFPVTLELAAP